MTDDTRADDPRSSSPTRVAASPPWPLVPPLDPDALPPDLRAQHDATDRAGLRDFVRVMAHAPEHFRRYNEAYLPLRFDNHLGPRLTEVVRLAVAQTTQCPVCMAGREPGATEAGLTEELVAGLACGDVTGFTDAEVAAITFTRKLATDHFAVDERDRAALRSHFDPTQIVEMSLLAVMCLVGRFSQVCGLEEGPTDAPAAPAAP